MIFIFLEENGVKSRSFLRELRRMLAEGVERAVAEGAGERGNSGDVSRRSFRFIMHFTIRTT